MPLGTKRLTARALLVADRIELAGLERLDVLGTNPLTFRSGDGFVVLFRYGAAVLIGLNTLEEDEVLRSLRARISGTVARSEEVAILEIAPDQEEQIPPGGPIQVRDLSVDRLAVIADALAKTVALSRDEEEVAGVFDVIDPYARRLSERGRPPGGRRAMLRLIGNALLVRHRVLGRVAVEEKPDVLWDRPDLERLYARLADEYELRERAGALHRKLSVIGETATALSDLIDAERSSRLEVIIGAMILFEVLLTIYQLVMGAH